MLSKKDIQIIQDLITSATEALKNVLKNDIANFKDEIIGRLDKIDTELTLTTGYGDQLEDHEQRIDKLEKVAVTHP